MDNNRKFRSKFIQPENQLNHSPRLPKAFWQKNLQKSNGKQEYIPRKTDSTTPIYGSLETIGRRQSSIDAELKFDSKMKIEEYYKCRSLYNKCYSKTSDIHKPEKLDFTKSNMLFSGASRKHSCDELCWDLKHQKSMCSIRSTPTPTMQNLNNKTPLGRKYNPILHKGCSNQRIRRHDSSSDIESDTNFQDVGEIISPLLDSYSVHPEDERFSYCSLNSSEDSESSKEMCSVGVQTEPLLRTMRLGQKHNASQLSNNPNASETYLKKAIDNEQNCNERFPNEKGDSLYEKLYKSNLECNRTAVQSSTKPCSETHKQAGTHNTPNISPVNALIELCGTTSHIADILSKKLEVGSTSNIEYANRFQSTKEQDQKFAIDNKMTRTKFESFVRKGFTQQTSFEKDCTTALACTKRCSNDSKINPKYNILCHNVCDTITSLERYVIALHYELYEIKKELNNYSVNGSRTSSLLNHVNQKLSTVKRRYGISKARTILKLSFPGMDCICSTAVTFLKTNFDIIKLVCAFMLGVLCKESLHSIVYRLDRMIK